MILSPLLMAASCHPITGQQKVNFDAQANRLETQMTNKVKQFPLDTELISIQNQFSGYHNMYLTHSITALIDAVGVCRSDMEDMQYCVDRATARITKIQEGIDAAKTAEKLDPEPSTQRQTSPPVNQQQPFTPETTQSIQMMNEGQFGVTNITPPPPIF